jgi:phosphate transport system permease protein
MTVLDRPPVRPDTTAGTTGPRLPGREGTGAPSRLPRRPRELRPAEIFILAISVASSFCVVWILFAQLTFLSGPVGFVICWLVGFLGMYWTVNYQVFGPRVASDRTVGALVTVGALCMFTPLILLVGFLVVKGYHLLSFHLLFATQKGVLEVCTPGVACPKPGVAHAIVGTMEQIGLAAAMGVPAGVLTAIYLNEVGGRFARIVRIIVTAMSGVPAIVAGAFVFSFLIGTLHEGYSGFAGALALSVLLLPTVTRGTEEVLKIVPNDLREASSALAAPQWRTVWSVVLPTARSGLITAVLLAVAVALGETAPLILTIFGNKFMNVNPFHGPQSALSLLTYTQVKSSQAADIQLGYTAALVLFIIVFVIFILARVLGSTWLGGKIRGRLNNRMANAAARGIAGEADFGGWRDAEHGAIPPPNDQRWDDDE